MRTAGHAGLQDAAFRSNEKQNHYALITGASTGIGRAMAEECARRKINLLLVALPEPELYSTAASLREQYAVEADCLGIDLTGRQAPEKVMAWCRENNYRVSILINNAGFGRGGLLEHTALHEYHKMIDLNNRAVIGLTYLFLPELKRNAPAHILITSSMEGTIALPYKAVYTATKHFLYGFSLSLREELQEFKVNVSVLCPGPTITSEEGLERNRMMGSKGRALAYRPEEVARQGIAGMFSGRQVIIPGLLALLLARISHWMPAPLRMRILRKLYLPFRHLGKPDQSGKR